MVVAQPCDGLFTPGETAQPFSSVLFKKNNSMGKQQQKLSRENTRERCFAHGVMQILHKKINEQSTAVPREMPCVEAAPESCRGKTTTYAASKEEEQKQGHRFAYANI